MTFFFWFCCGFIVYTYLLYPLLMVIWAHISPRPTRFVDGNLPSVSMIVAAYNEEEVIGQKLVNGLAIDYPAARLEFLFGSDGSSDETNKMLSEVREQRVRTFLYRERAGKLNVLNKVVPEAQGDILLFSDANTMYETDAVQKLVRHFADPSVGGVCGKLRLVNPNQNVGGQGEGLYWRYENILKQAEGRIYSVIGANGAIYAIRRELFRPLPNNVLIMDDFLIPLRVLEQGYRVIYEPEAVATENTSPGMQGEFRRKVRIAAANFNGIPYILALLNPLQGVIAFVLWSHKIIRWLVPFLAISAFVSNLFLLNSSDIYLLSFGLQLFFYIAALVGYLADRLFRHSGPLMIFYYLVAMNSALFLGFWRSVTRTQKMAWERVEH